MNLGAKKQKKYLFIGHNMDQTGGPLVLLDILKEYTKKVDPNMMELWAMGIDERNRKFVEELGVKIIDYTNFELNREFDRLLNITPDSFVMMNTTAVGYRLRDRIFQYLEDEKLERVLWYIHEGVPSYHFEDEMLVARVNRLVAAGQLELVTLAEQILADYEEFFGFEVHKAPYRFTLEDTYYSPKTAADFSEIRFVVNGTAFNGRKGQLPILMAFALLQERFELNKANYRDFQLKFIGVGPSFVGDFIHSIGGEFLGNKFISTGRVTREESLVEMNWGNANITLSLMEALPLNIMESMFMEQFLIRNKVSGYEEQLVDQKNGFTLTGEINQLVEVLETVLNKDKYSDEQLLKMAQESKQMVAAYEDISYYEAFSQILLQD